MNPTSLPDNILTKMSAKDRKALGVQTGEEAQEKFIAKSERDLQNQIANFLRLKGIWFYCARMDRKTTTSKGCPDFLFAWCYFPVSLEVKFGNGKLSDEQFNTHNKMLKNGWRAHVVRSLEDVKQILDALEQEHNINIRF